MLMLVGLRSWGERRRTRQLGDDASAGSDFVIGYGGAVDIPTIDVISTERNVVGNLVGNHNDLVELMAPALTGRVTMLTQTYPLDAVNDAMDDHDAGRLRGRGIWSPPQPARAAGGLGGTAAESQCTHACGQHVTCRDGDDVSPIKTRNEAAGILGGGGDEFHALAVSLLLKLRRDRASRMPRCR